MKSLWYRLTWTTLSHFWSISSAGWGTFPALFCRFECKNVSLPLSPINSPIKTGKSLENILPSWKIVPVRPMGFLHGLASKYKIGESLQDFRLENELFTNPQFRSPHLPWQNFEQQKLFFPLYYFFSFLPLQCIQYRLCQKRKIVFLYLTGTSCIWVCAHCLWSCYWAPLRRAWLITHLRTGKSIQSFDSLPLKNGPQNTS